MCAAGFVGKIERLRGGCVAESFRAGWVMVKNWWVDDWGA